MDELTDTELVRLARADDTGAFRLLLERYQTMAFAIALHRIMQRETAQDLVQEAVLQAYLSLDQLRDPASFKSWFYGIVLNVCRNWQRSRVTSLLSLDFWDEYQPVAEMTDPFAVVEEDELRCAVQQAVQRLSAKNRIVMFLFYYENLSLEEIAAQLCLSLTAVKSRLHEGRGQLKKQLMLSYPDLSLINSSKQRRIIMTTMNVVKVVPQEQRVLIVLHDLSGRQILPLWLSPPAGFPLAILLNKKSRKGAPNEPSITDFVSSLLRATGGIVQAVHIDELQDQLLYARVLLQTSNGNHEIKARLEDALILAVQENSPIIVADEVVKRIGVSLASVGGATDDKGLEQAIKTLLEKTPFPSTPKLHESKSRKISNLRRGYSAGNYEAHFCRIMVGLVGKTMFVERRQVGFNLVP